MEVHRLGAREGSGDLDVQGILGTLAKRGVRLCVFVCVLKNNF